MKSRILLTAGAAALACTQALAATPAANAGPWAKVPALPTACFSSQDQWWDANIAAIDAVQQDHYKQDETNSAIEQNFRKVQEENPMAMAQAMQQAMMNDPANAQKYMEQMMQQGQQTTADVTAQGEKEQQFDVEAKSVMKQYEAALATASGPAEARWAAVKKKRGYDASAPGPSESGEPDWVYQEWNGILHDRDSAYVSNCAHWWAAGSPIHAYLKRYRDYLVLERTPSRKKGIDDVKLDQYKSLNVPTEGFRTTADYDAAELYMKKAQAMFGERRAVPRCQTADRCDAMN